MDEINWAIAAFLRVDNLLVIELKWVITFNSPKGPLYFFFFPADQKPGHVQLNRKELQRIMLTSFSWRWN
ncbi:MAG: hypothetical protein K9J30_14255 [Bacteroidales bacterium]|nr:hypothetical protein [Bacteroidales bacterium]